MMVSPPSGCAGPGLGDGPHRRGRLHSAERTEEGHRHEALRESPGVGTPGAVLPKPAAHIPEGPLARPLVALRDRRVDEPRLRALRALRREAGDSQRHGACERWRACGSLRWASKSVSVWVL